MRIAHVVQRYPPALGGSEAYFARLSRHLAAQGDIVTVFTTNALDLTAFWSRRGRTVPAGISVDDGVEVHRYPIWTWPGRRYVLKGLSIYPNLNWQCLTMPCNPIAPGMWRDAGRERRAFSIVHATAFPYGWPLACARRLARKLGTPFVLTPFLHLGDPTNEQDRTRRGYLSPPLVRLLFAADRIFVQTSLEEETLLDLGIERKHLIRLGMGVTPSECTGGDRRRARQAWDIDADTLVVGHLANQSEEKGSVDLIRACENLWKRGRKFCLVLAGPAMPNFLSFWRQLGPMENIHYLGIIDDRQKRDFFAGIDLFALPSRSDSFGLVLLEAWANRLPNLAYRAGGVAEVVRHERDGLLTPCGDVAALADALDGLLKSNDLRSRLAEAGHDRIEAEFRWEDKLQRVRAIYEELHNEHCRRESLAT